MSKLSVSDAAERLGVSPARVRQRIEDGSLVAEKIGGRWLVDLDASRAAPAQRGRPVLPSSVWWSLASAEIARAALPKVVAPSALFDIQRSMKPVVDAAAFRASLLPRMRLAELALADASDDQAGVADDLDVLAPGFLHEAMSLSRSSRGRAIHRFVEAVVARDYPALLAWLSNRGSRNLYVVAAQDLGVIRADDRLLSAGVSHPDSNFEDPRVVEAYVSAAELDGIVGDYWLEKPVVDERPNVVLHVVPVRPPEVGPMLLAADLAEHGGPREVQRAHELLDAAIAALVPPGAQAPAPDGRAQE